MTKTLHIKQGVTLMLIAALSYSIMAALVKLADTQISLSLILFSRFGFGFIYIIIAILITHRKNTLYILKIKHWPALIIRILAGLLTMILLYNALRYIPLVNALLLSTTYPLFIPILTTLFFGRYTPPRIWFFLTLGFIGVALVLNPTAGVFQPIALLALGSGVCLAIVMLSIRILARTHHPQTQLFYFFLLTGIITGLATIVEWQPITLKSFYLLLFIGIAGIAFQECMTRAITHAPARLVSPIMYTNIIFSAILGWIFWKEIPSTLGWIGIGLVCFSAIMTVVLTKTEDLMKKRTKK